LLVLETYLLVVPLFLSVGTLLFLAAAMQK